MFDCFKKGTTYSSHGEVGDRALGKKWGIVIPHTLISPGAYSPQNHSRDRISEYFYALEMINYMGLPYRTRDDGGVLGATKYLKERNVTASIEPHLNAYNSRAEGFEILVLKGDEVSIDTAEIIASEFKKAFPERRMRHGNGLKIVKSGDRGASNLIKAKNAGMDIALLSEFFFIDNPNEWIKPKDMANFLNEVLV